MNGHNGGMDTWQGTDNVLWQGLGKSGLFYLIVQLSKIGSVSIHVTTIRSI